MSDVKLIERPTVRVIAKTALLDDQVEEYLGECDGLAWWHGDGAVEAAATDLLPEVAGRLCYDSFRAPRPGGNPAYLGHVKGVGHGSVLEHTTLSLLLTGVSRGLTHELVRHRAGMAYSQESQRYVDAADTPFVVPPELRGEVELARRYEELPTAGDYEALAAEYGLDPEKRFAALRAGRAWLLTVNQTKLAYAELADYLGEKVKARYPDMPATERRKAARQTARGVLPNAAATKIVVTGNARAWRHFVEQRCSRHADAEIRVLAGAVLRALKEHAPNLFADYEEVPLPDGTFEAATPTRKV